MSQFYAKLRDRQRKIQLSAHANAKRPSTDDMVRIEEAFKALPNNLHLRGGAAEKAAGQLLVIHNLLVPFEPVQ